MRPTPYEVYANPEIFISLLEAQGVENAQAKVSSLIGIMIDYRTVEVWHKKILKDLRSLEQQPYRYPTPARRGVMAVRNAAKAREKRIGSLKMNVLRYNQYLLRKMELLTRKISKWPELSYDPNSLSKQPDPKMVQKKLLKRTRFRSIQISG